MVKPRSRSKPRDSIAGTCANPKAKSGTRHHDMALESCESLAMYIFIFRRARRTFLPPENTLTYTPRHFRRADQDEPSAVTIPNRQHVCYRRSG